jgi:hypothetical protein
MAAGVTRLSDLIVPQIFNPYTQLITEQKSRLVQSGAVAVDSKLSSELAGGGLTFNDPSFKDLDNDVENISSDDPAVMSSPNKIGTAQEIQVRLSRNNSWSSMDLAGDLIGPDPMTAIGNRVGAYWARRQQAAFLATMTGVFADNAAAPTGGDTHLINDMTHNVSGAIYAAGTTDFSTEAFLDAAITMGDSMEDLGLVFVHSIVYNRMLKNNLIDFIPDSTNTAARGIATFLGRFLVVDDGMPNATGVFETWMFGNGAIRWGRGAPKTPTEADRVPAAGNGGGQEILFNRVEWIIHPKGYAYIGVPANGGPSNLNTANNLAAAGSWSRRYPERKQIKIARLITREF